MQRTMATATARVAAAAAGPARRKGSEQSREAKPERLVLSLAALSAGRWISIQQEGNICTARLCRSSEIQKTLSNSSLKLQAPLGKSFS